MNDMNIKPNDHQQPIEDPATLPDDSLDKVAGGKSKSSEVGPAAGEYLGNGIEGK